MLANFFNSAEFRATHKISFSYRHTAKYYSGFKNRVSTDFPIFPVNFPDLSDVSQLPNRMPLLIRRVLMKGIRVLFTWPLFAYQVFVLNRLFRRLAPEILHINNGGYPAALSARAAAIAGRLASIPKIVMVVNNFAEEYNNLSRWIEYPVDRFVVRSVDIFITGSRAAGEQLRSVLSLPFNRTLSIHNGIADRNPTYSVAENRKRLGLTHFDGVIFGVVALLIPRKGHQVLLDAVLHISKLNYSNRLSFKILIEGSGELRDKLISFVNVNALNKYIEFVGVEENVLDFMSILDVLILPSVEGEDLPNVVLEAMALGKPVIASHLAGTPEQIVDYKNGILVKPRDIQQLGDAIIFFLENKLARIAMGKAAFMQHKKKFESGIAVDRYASMYRKLLESKHDKQ